MTNYVQLPTVDGPDYYVNPELVSSLTAAPTNPAGTFVDIQGDAPSRIVALGTPAAVAALLSAASPSSAIVGPLSTVYVEPPTPAGRGDDATGQRGNAALPFASLDAALAAMQSGDTMVLASGTYECPSSPIPAALTSGVIRSSSGATSTVIDAQGTGRPGLDFGGASRLLWRLDGFRIAQDPGASALTADGSAAAAGTFFVNGSLALSGVVITGGDVLAKYVGTLVCANTVGVSGGTWRLESCNVVEFLAAQFVGGESIEIDSDNDDPLSPTLGLAQLGPARFDGACIMPTGTITCAGQGGVYQAPGAVLSQVNGSALTKSIVGPWFSSVTLLGAVASCDFTGVGAWPDVQGVMDLRGASIAGQCNIAQTPGAVNTLRVAAAGAEFGSLVSIGEGCLADMRTSSFAGGILAQLATAGSNGRIIPPTFALDPQPIASPTPFAFPFRLDSDQYAVAVDIDDGNAGVCATTVRTNIGFQVQPQAAPPGATMRAIVSFYDA